VLKRLEGETYMDDEKEENKNNNRRQKRPSYSSQRWIAGWLPSPKSINKVARLKISNMSQHAGGTATEGRHVCGRIPV
jgi:hypothetical protein